MPDGVQVHTEPSVLGGLVLVDTRPGCDYLCLGGIDVAHAEVEVELLGGAPPGHVGTTQSSIRWNASVARPSGFSGVTPPPGGLSVEKSRLEPSSMGQPIRRE